MPPQKNFGILSPLRSLLVHFSDRLWFSNDHISSADKTLNTYRASYTGADKEYLLDSDVKGIVDTWNRKSRRIGSCLG